MYELCSALFSTVINVVCVNLFWAIVSNTNNSLIIDFGSFMLASAP